MKPLPSIRMIPICLFSASMGVVLGNEPAPKPQFRDAATHDSLSRILQAEGNRNPMLEIKPSETPDPSKNTTQIDILDRSDIISFNGLTTLVPKRAILALPDSMKSRIGNHPPGHRLVHWSEFFTANRGWISTIEVSRAQAEGNATLTSDSQERITKATQMIVATFQGGPISVLPEKTQEPSTENQPTKQP